jgi:hypothetical protein
MTTRSVTKQLAGIEDLLLGVGSVQQTRAATLLTINKIALVWPVATLAELKALDTAMFVFSDLIAATYKRYYFSSSSTATANDGAVVMPNSGVGRWLQSTAA